MATHHQVQPVDRACHFHITGGLNGVAAVLKMPHMGGGNYEIGLLVQLGHQLGGLLYGTTELQSLHMRRVAQLLRVVGGQAHYGYPHTTQIEDLVRGKHAFPFAVDIGRQHGKARQLALHFQGSGAFVKLVVAHRHGVITQQIHALEVGHGLLQV